MYEGTDACGGGLDRLAWRVLGQVADGARASYACPVGR